MDFVPEYVNKVMNNLLSNAFKFTPEYGKVSMKAWREGDRLLIDIEDTGQGMYEETLAHIFEPFCQGESDTRNVGTGVGMALVKQIMDAVEGYDNSGERNRQRHDIPHQHADTQTEPGNG